MTYPGARFATCLVGLSMLATSGRASSRDDDSATSVVVRFLVRVPVDTPADADLRLVGDADVLGRWNPAKGLRLERQKDGLHAGECSVARGSKLEFKLCNGSWARVERDERGRDISNRELAVERDVTIEITVAGWATGAREPRPSTRTGDIRQHPAFPSKRLSLPRDLVVYLPPGYATGSERYPVLYLHDGQNLFDAATAAFGVEWKVDEAAERLIAAGRLEPLIVVGIGNTRARMSEYTPPAEDPSATTDARERAEAEPRAGEEPRAEADPRAGANTRLPALESVGDRYADFIVEELKPFIDREYRTMPGRDHTAVGGSSLGGLISLFIVSRYPEVFSKCAAVSPSLFWNDRQLLRELAADGAWLARTKLWIDMGTSEGRAVESGVTTSIEAARELVRILDENRRVPGRDYYYWEVAGGRHDEAAWAARVDKILLFLFAR